MSEKQRSTTFNIIATLITKFILLFGGFIVSILLARLLGPEGKGMIAAIFVFPLLMVSLADMGIRQSTAYYVGKGQHKISDIISSIAFLWLITSFVAIILVFIYYALGPSDKYPWIVLTVALAAIPIKLIEQYAKGIMLGKNQISTINISQLIQLAANIISVLVLVWFLDLGVLGAAIVQIVTALTIAIYYLIKVRIYHQIKIKPISPIPKLLFLKGFSFAAVLFISNLNYKIDIMILDRMVIPSEIGIYSVGVNFAELLWQIPSAIGMVIFSKSTTTKKSMDSVNRSTAVLRLVLPSMVICSLIIAVFAPLVIRMFYGVDFTEAGNILRILLPGTCVITVFKVLQSDLAGRGYPLFALRVLVITVLINVFLNFILIPEYGIYGAAIASAVSYVLTGVGIGFVYSRKEKIPLKDILFLKKSDIDRVKDVVQKNIFNI